MTDEGKKSNVARTAPNGRELERRVREQTPARLMEGRAGSSYRTETQLRLRRDHAAARDAVRTELDLIADLGQEFIERWRIFEVSTRARTKEEYLLRPDLGRTFDSGARDAIGAQCPHGCRLQIAIGDGLSVRAVAAQVPRMLPLLIAGAAQRGHSDADRNLVSNIHAAGVPPVEAAARILNLVAAMLRERTSGVHLKEQLQPPLQP